eukprot:gene42467-56283_t
MFPRPATPPTPVPDPGPDPPAPSALVLSGSMRGMPWWRREGGGGWITAGPRGHWLVSAEEGHVAKGLGWMVTTRPHRGVALPPDPDAGGWR